MKYIFFLSALLLICSCTSSSEKNEVETKTDAVAATQVPAENKHPSGLILLTGESDEVRQRLEITFLDSIHITYNIIASSKSVDCRQTLNGTATRKYNGDAEMDEDEEGNMYAADEYWDDKTDGFSIRVKSEYDKARIHYPLPSDSAEACSRLMQDILLLRSIEK